MAGLEAFSLGGTLQEKQRFGAVTVVTKTPFTRYYTGCAVVQLIVQRAAQPVVQPVVAYNPLDHVDTVYKLLPRL